MSASLDDLTAAVAAESSVEDGVIVLLTNLSAQLTAAQNDPVKIQSILDGLNANTKKLTDAVTANTPAASPPTP